MKTYKATENIVFAVGEKEYILRPGDEVELDENQNTTKSLIERKRIEPLPAHPLKVEPTKRPDPANMEPPKPVKVQNPKN